MNLMGRKWDLDKVFGRSLEAFAFIIPLSPSLGAKILVLLLAFSIHVIIVRKRYRQVLKQAWSSGLYLLILMIGLLYSSDLTLGTKVIESSLSFIAVPVLFSARKEFTKTSYERIFFSFTFGLLVACLICLAHSFIDYLGNGDSTVFFFNQLTSVLAFQPTYLAYYLIFAITFLVYCLYFDRIKSPLVFPLTAIIILFGVLLLTGGLTSMISLIFVFSFFILKFLQEKDPLGKRITLVLICFMLTSMFVTNYVSKDSRIGHENDYWERSVLWESALNATPDIFWGVGTGDFKQALNLYYQGHNLSDFAKSNANSHNEFTQVFFSNGLLGLFGLLLLMGRPLYLSVVRRNILGILAFFPFFIYGITEVFLGRYQGVIFFMFLHQAFISYYISPAPVSVENS